MTSIHAWLWPRTARHVTSPHDMAGLNIQLSVAVDLTAQNGSPEDSTSLHYVTTASLNPYQSAIKAVADILVIFVYTCTHNVKQRVVHVHHVKLHLSRGLFNCVMSACVCLNRQCVDKYTLLDTYIHAYIHILHTKLRVHTPSKGPVDKYAHAMSACKRTCL